MASVAAVVVTHNDPDALRCCLRALEEQTRPPDEVIVVDNASTPPVPDLGCIGIPTFVLRSEVNGGPAGGFADGLECFLQRRAEWAWVMDDDCEPEPGALAVLLDDAGRTRPSLVVPQLLSSGRRVHWPAWSGVLVPREIVEAVGVPRRDFVWWAEDTEYLQWRIPKSGFSTVESSARVHSDHPRRRGDKPEWKWYYEARNATYYRLHLSRRRILRRMGRLLFRVPVSILLRGGRHRFRHLRMHALGLCDGALGRLGPRIPLP